jgi:ribokinase
MRRNGKTRGRVLVIGSFVTDLACLCGELPRSGETVFGTDFRSGPGGKGANQAVAAKRAGAETKFLSKVGDDPLGAAAKSFLLAERIGDDILTDEEAPTGAALIAVKSDTGENAIVVAPGASLRISDDEIASFLSDLAPEDVIVVQTEAGIRVIDAALDAAGKIGARVLLNPAPYVPLGAARVSEADVVTPNETEASQMTGIEVNDPKSAAAAAEILRERGCAAVVITLGANGCIVSDAAGTRLIPPFPVNAIDTTGAGDAFSGNLAAALAEGAELDEACVRASAGAAISVTRRGTAPAMPFRSEIEAFLQAEIEKKTKNEE